MSNEQQKPPQRTASQRIEDLENAMMQAFQALDQIARDGNTTREAVKLLGNKTTAMIQVLAGGQVISESAVGDQMILNNIAELQSKVSALLEQGVLTPEDTTTAQSFVVGQEVNDEGKVVNPRIQFAIGTLSEEKQRALSGKKSGEIVNIEDGKLKFQVLESYKIRGASQRQSAAPTEESAGAPAVETPALVAVPTDAVPETTQTQAQA